MASKLKRIRMRRAVLVPLLLCWLSALVPAGAGPTPPTHPGRPGVFIPEATNAGNWEGTWYFNSVDSKMALWMRTRRSKTEMKLRYDSGLAPVSFETDWSGNATYYAFEKPATFRCKLTKLTPERIEGSWSWDYQFQSMGRSEKGTFTLFRAMDGRILVFKFDTYELTETKNGATGRSNTLPAWTFAKASKFPDALWDELPF